MSAEKRARELRELIDQYWTLAYAEGKEGRTHDTEAGDAQRVSMEIDLAITAALTPQWEPISTAPRDGAMHLRGLWVQQHTRDGVVTNWEVYHGFENQDGDFVDAQHGDDHGWPANEYDAWLPLPAPPESD